MQILSAEQKPKLANAAAVAQKWAPKDMRALFMAAGAFVFWGAQAVAQCPCDAKGNPITISAGGNGGNGDNGNNGGNGGNGNNGNNGGNGGNGDNGNNGGNGGNSGTGYGGNSVAKSGNVTGTNTLNAGSSTATNAGNTTTVGGNKSYALGMPSVNLAPDSFGSVIGGYSGESLTDALLGGGCRLTVQHEAAQWGFGAGFFLAGVNFAHKSNNNLFYQGSDLDIPQGKDAKGTVFDNLHLKVERCNEDAWAKIGAYYKNEKVIAKIGEATQVNVAAFQDADKVNKVSHVAACYSLTAAIDSADQASLADLSDDGTTRGGAQSMLHGCLSDQSTSTTVVYRTATPPAVAAPSVVNISVGCGGTCQTSPGRPLPPITTPPAAVVTPKQGS